jgi:hypothetical protein
MRTRLIALVTCVAVAAALAASHTAHLHVAARPHEALLHTHFEAHQAPPAIPSTFTNAEHDSESVRSVELFTANKVSAAPVIMVAAAYVFDFAGPSAGEALRGIEQARAHGPPDNSPSSPRAPPA